MPKVIDNPRQLILEHAKKIMYEEGYYSFNIRSIAKSCGLGVGTIYNYFPTKKDIMTQLIMDYWAGFFIAVNDISAHDVPLYQKLREIYIQLEKFVNIFLDVWIRVESVSYRQFAKLDGKVHRDFIERLAARVEVIIANESQVLKANEKPDISSGELSMFIVQNYLMMAQMKHFNYADFEKIIMKLL